MVLNNSTLAHRCRREGVHPIINLQGVRLARVRYAPDNDQIAQRSEMS
jgi:hypothetical protein